MRSSGHIGLLSAGGRGSVHIGYGALVAAELEAEEGEASSDDDAENDAYYAEEGRLALFYWRLQEAGTEDRRYMGYAEGDIRQEARGHVVEPLGSAGRLPASMAVAWCAIPFAISIARRR